MFTEVAETTVLEGKALLFEDGVSKAVPLCRFALKGVLPHFVWLIDP
ncbi:hypothetical protein V9K92_01705 [Phyllobacterium sp. CCNWLW109]